MSPVRTWYTLSVSSERTTGADPGVCFIDTPTAKN